LSYVAEYYASYQIVWFDKTHLYGAVLSAALFATVSILFTFSRFSFGYFLGFYFYTMILGFLWLVQSTKLNYDHTLAAVSAFISAVAFLVPALFITWPIRQRFVLPRQALDNLLSFILILAAVIIAAGVYYNFEPAPAPPRRRYPCAP
jgi:hypothetical protein